MVIDQPRRMRVLCCRHELTIVAPLHVPAQSSMSRCVGPLYRACSALMMTVADFCLNDAEGVVGFSLESEIVIITINDAETTNNKESRVVETQVIIEYVFLLNGALRQDLR